MANRDDIERALRELYTARVRGDVDGIGRIFADDCDFRLAGSSEASPVAASTRGVAEFRTLVSQLIRVFEMSDLEILTIVVDGAKAAAHWRVTCRSTVTGRSAKMELLDIIEFKDGRIASLTEFCDTAMAARMMAP